ncbi:MAG: protein-L-isoaspartate(D-aspartate) O-methyltransferase [Nitrospirota bacterium]
MNQRSESERKKMVNENIIKRGIFDEKVIEAILKVPRELFVEEALQSKAYGDHPLPIGCGQTISQPYMVALMTQYLKLSGTERVLEIGTGSGYQAAVLAELVQRVYTIERVKILFEKAQKVLLEKLKYKNIVTVLSDGTLGLANFAPFDRIIVTAAAPDVPKILTDQLVNNGILIIPKGDKFFQTLTIITKRDGELLTQDAGGCVFVPLIGKYGWKQN